MAGLGVLAATLAFSAAAMLALWALSLALRDASIVDIYWGPGFALIALLAFRLAEGGDPARGLLVTTLACAWGGRLGLYLWWRSRGRGEDPRYRAMRRHHGERFGRVSLVTVFGLQGLLMWTVSLPLQLAQLSAVGGLSALDALGAALVLLGLGFESVGDWQLARFRGDAANADRVMDRGLWRYTRHPNYFGDCVVWWGFATIALATPAGAFGLVSPVVMTFFLLRISGVAMLERSIGKRRPEYEAYQERTSAFFPLPPR